MDEWTDLQNNIKNRPLKKHCKNYIFIDVVLNVLPDRVNVILPGFIKTPMTDVVPDKVSLSIYVNAT